MNKIFLAFAFSLVANSLIGQTSKFGKFEPEEIALEEVAFEPEADAVMLIHQGESRFFGDVFETSYFVRLKILKESGKAYSDVRVRYYAGDRRVEEISNVKAEITNFQNGIENNQKLKNSSIYDVDLENGYREMRISFPNVEVGSILEYSYKKSDKNIRFLDAWTFQNNIPTLLSQYKITMTPAFRYRTLMQGSNLLNRGEKEESYGTYTYTLRDLYAFKEEPYMKNYRDYMDRVEFQLSQYAQGSEWVDLTNSWPKLGDDLIDYYKEKGYYRSGLIDREFLDVDLTGETENEQARKAYYYLRDEFLISGDDWIYPEQTLPQLLKAKTGTPAELILAYMGLLKSVGIKCEPVLIGSKGYGRSEIVPFPFLTQFDELLLVAEIDGKRKFLDLNDKTAPFGYVDLDKQVKAGLHLKEEQSALIPIEIQHKSNSLIISEATYSPDSGLVMKNTFREYFYKGLNARQVIERMKKNNQPIEELFLDETRIFEVKNLEVKDDLVEKNFYTLSMDMSFPGSENEELLLFNPLQFSSYSENPFTADYRLFPVDFGYVFSETSLFSLMIPEGYEVDDYPLEESITIPGGYLTFQYKPTLMDDMLKISAKFEVRGSLIPAERYGDLKFFMEAVASKLNTPVVLKKVSTP